MSYEDVVLQQEKERLEKLKQAEAQPKESKDEEVKAKRPYKRRDTSQDSQ